MKTETNKSAGARTQKITLTDTFNGVVISGHRTILAAVRAQRLHLRAVRRANGRDSYLTYSITGLGVTPDLIDEARMEDDASRY